MLLFIVDCFMISSLFLSLHNRVTKIESYSLLSMARITTGRISFIDLTKGICILLVILFHVGGPVAELDPHFILSSFRMPLYFFISGVFFKPYGSPQEFFIKKVNRLLIPFLFFLLIPFLLMWTLRLLKPNFFHIAPSLNDLIIPFTGHQLIRYNPPIWFLLALFTCNSMFYLLHRWLRDKNQYLFMLSIAVLGCIGYTLSQYRIELPLYIHVACSTIPFYFGGFWIRRYNFFLQKHRYDKFIPLVLLGLGTILYFSAGYTGLRCNSIGNSLIGFYTAGFSGVLFILLVCKIIGHIPIISQIGKTSIVPLGIHATIIVVLQHVIYNIFDHPWWQVVVIYLLTVIMCYAFAPIIITLFPHVVAQKDLIKIQRGPDKLHPLVYRNKQLLSPEEERVYFRDQRRLERQILIRRMKKNQLTAEERSAMLRQEAYQAQWAGAQPVEELRKQLKEIQNSDSVSH